MDTNMKARLEKQPYDMPSAGSVFKKRKWIYNSSNNRRSRFKGQKVGGAVVSEKHAGFIVNTGNATAKDVIDLIEIIKSNSKRKIQRRIRKQK